MPLTQKDRLLGAANSAEVRTQTYERADRFKFPANLKSVEELVDAMAKFDGVVLKRFFKYLRDAEAGKEWLKGVELFFKYRWEFPASIIQRSDVTKIVRQRLTRARLEEILQMRTLEEVEDAIFSEAQN